MELSEKSMVSINLLQSSNVVLSLNSRYAGIAIKSAPKKLNLTFNICVVQSSEVVIQNDG